jgi:hypothetical protein
VLENVIGGRRAPVDGAGLQDVLDPATGELLAVQFGDVIHLR